MQLTLQFLLGNAGPENLEPAQSAANNKNQKKKAAPTIYYASYVLFYLFALGFFYLFFLCCLFVYLGHTVIEICDLDSLLLFKLHIKHWTLAS